MKYHTINAKAPVTSPGTLQIRAKAVLLQNTGQVDAYVNTHMTIRAGSTLQLAPFPDDGVIYDEWNVTFAAGPGTTRLEVIEVQSDDIIC
jgi:hypothetical protein